MEKKRFERNILVEGFGIDGQNKLAASRVLVIGAGGLGSPVLLYLAAAGVGTLGIADHDSVDITNLQRQIIHNNSDIGILKIDSAAEKLKALYPEINVEKYPFKITEENGRSILSTYDFIIECCDNYEAKFLINDLCVELRKPFSHGAVLAMRGDIMTYVPGHACYRCVFSEPPAEGTMPTSAQAGIVGSVAGIAGSIQATEAIKYLTGMGNLLVDSILIFDGRSMEFTKLNLAASDECNCSNNSI